MFHSIPFSWTAAVMRFNGWLTLLLIPLAGCGDGLSIAPVSGVVTLGGKPLANASINTQPIGHGTRNPGPGSVGVTDADGRFELELVQPKRKGAIVGEHHFMISPPSTEAATHEPTKSKDGTYEYWTDDPGARHDVAAANWPAKFTDGSLTLDVPAEGTDDVKFDLSR